MNFIQCEGQIYLKSKLPHVRRISLSIFVTMIAYGVTTQQTFQIADMTTESFKGDMKLKIKVTSETWAFFSER